MKIDDFKSKRILLSIGTLCVALLLMSFTLIVSNPFTATENIATNNLDKNMTCEEKCKEYKAKYVYITDLDTDYQLYVFGSEEEVDKDLRQELKKKNYYIINYQGGANNGWRDAYAGPCEKFNKENCFHKSISKMEYKKRNKSEYLDYGPSLVWVKACDCDENDMPIIRDRYGWINNKGSIDIPEDSRPQF